MPRHSVVQGSGCEGAASNAPPNAAKASPPAAPAWVKKLISMVPFASDLTRAILSLGFRDSPSYWETRYAAGRDSGAGSHGPLADFKGRFLRGFIRENKIRDVIDFGCGDGNQIGWLDSVRYVGFDVSITAVERCRNKYREDAAKTFVHYDPGSRFEDLSTPKADMAMSLDVIYHLVEDDIFGSYIAKLFAAARRFVVVYSTNFDGLTESPHVRHRCVTSYIENNFPDWALLRQIANPHKGKLSDCDFFVFEHVNAGGS